MEERLTNIEIKLAYLEDFVSKLQTIAVEQGNLLDKLTAENRALKTRLVEISDSLESDIPNRRPPHY